MSQMIAVPGTQLIVDILSGILDREVKVQKVPPMDLKAKAQRVYASYRDTELPITCLCVSDLSLVVHAAGALLAFPACTINDALRTGVLEDGLLDAAKEIMNISAQMFDEMGHKVLRQVCTNPDQLTEDARQVLAAPIGRLDLALSITGVGSGKMSVLIGKIETYNER